MEAKRKRTKNIIIAAVLVAAAILMAALPAMLSSGQKEEDKGTAKSVAVQRGDIDSTVAGAGTLSGEDGVKITVPHGVEITEYLVQNGDIVAEGQALAAVDKISVMNTVATVQNNLEYIAGEIRTAASGATNASLAAPAAGRVKAVYAAAGDDVQSVIREHGALMVVSLDGRMALDAETASAAATPGKSVTVRLGDGTEYPAVRRESYEDLCRNELQEVFQSSAGAPSQTPERICGALPPYPGGYMRGSAARSAGYIRGSAPCPAPLGIIRGAAPSPA